MSELLNKVSEKFIPKQPEAGSIRYAGLNIRLFSAIIDMFVLTLILMPLAFLMPKGEVEQPPMEVQEAIYEYQHQMITPHEFIEKVLPFFKEKVLPRLKMLSTINLILFSVLLMVVWKYTDSSPGKMLLKLKIVSLKDFGTPTTYQYFMRLIGYIIASIPLGLGFLLIALNRKKRGLHDYMAGTVVVYAKPFDPVAENKKLKYQAIFLLVTILIVAVIYSIKNN